MLSHRMMFRHKTVSEGYDLLTKNMLRSLTVSFLLKYFFKLIQYLFKFKNGSDNVRIYIQ
jgi:hypothetical protein